jgi:hypothetical protein
MLAMQSGQRVRNLVRNSLDVMDHEIILGEFTPPALNLRRLKRPQRQHVAMIRMRIEMVSKQPRIELCDCEQHRIALLLKCGPIALCGCQGSAAVSCDAHLSICIRVILIQISADAVFASIHCHVQRPVIIQEIEQSESTYAALQLIESVLLFCTPPEAV